LANRHSAPKSRQVNQSTRWKTSLQKFTLRCASVPGFKRNLWPSQGFRVTCQAKFLNSAKFLTYSSIVS